MKWYYKKYRMQRLSATPLDKAWHSLAGPWPFATSLLLKYLCCGLKPSRRKSIIRLWPFVLFARQWEDTLEKGMIPAFMNIY